MTTTPNLPFDEETNNLLLLDTADADVLRRQVNIWRRAFIESRSASESLFRELLSTLDTYGFYEGPEIFLADANGDADERAALLDRLDMAPEDREPGMYYATVRLYIDATVCVSSPTGDPHADDSYATAHQMALDALRLEVAEGSQILDAEIERHDYDEVSFTKIPDYDLDNIRQ